MSKELKFRNQSVYLTDEVAWIAKALNTAALSGTDANRTVDQFVDCELRDKWTREYPEVVLAYEVFQSAKQRAKESYDLIQRQVTESIKASKGVKSSRE